VLNLKNIIPLTIWIYIAKQPPFFIMIDNKQYKSFYHISEWTENYHYYLSEKPLFSQGIKPDLKYHLNKERDFFTLEILQERDSWEKIR